MKLAFCTRCSDVFKLDTDMVRSCKCGATTGQYKPNGLHAWVKGPCIALGLLNDSVAQAVRVQGSGYPKPIKVEATTIPPGWSAHMNHVQ